jgi:hypothetical protein
MRFDYGTAKKMNAEQVGWIKRLSFSNALNIADISGLLSEELFDKLSKINKTRNHILHGLVLENEKIQPLELETHFNLCQEATDQLVIQMLRNLKLQSISTQIINDTVKEIEDRKSKEGLNDATKE